MNGKNVQLNSAFTETPIVCPLWYQKQAKTDYLSKSHPICALQCLLLLILLCIWCWERGIICFPTVAIYEQPPTNPDSPRELSQDKVGVRQNKLLIPQHHEKATQDKILCGMGVCVWGAIGLLKMRNLKKKLVQGYCTLFLDG